MFEIQVWAQMFFDDGSVSQGVRFHAEDLDDNNKIIAIAEKLLVSVRRSTGLLVIWGAGNLMPYNVTSSLASSLPQDFTPISPIA